MSTQVMGNEAPVRVQEPEQKEIVICPSCRCPFSQKRPTQRFCSGVCKATYARDVGMQGRVASVTKLMHGRVSVTIHFEAGPAADRAMALEKGDLGSWVKGA